MDQRKRLEDIGSVLIRQGFKDVVQEIIPITARLRLRGVKPRIVAESSPSSNRALDEYSTFIKFGHYMRTRRTCYPNSSMSWNNYMTELGRFHTADKQDHWENFGKRIFAGIDQVPLSSVVRSHVATLIDVKKWSSR
jgi:hypothetical protein